ncbi:D-glycero-beta-D-manno-heptose 1,7-bisphosphate 7-phosphatase [Acidithiobacillus sp. CV18-2]|uniref:D,D-heptose 1,7-bisphosphate phosphatase n=1 Tax=Igneacidithiobacillus copahuensis TaxID=2724909 RepID=A0AAE2YQY6_9PROT|nr:D-glycero-beta-D-manno-heptose 1,7-bisphosphate 7-phosphatase [Igneacidithiobacillus copahuensis]MBU2754718.1 D-glycero-beta-D-manno-heptose 1,7-bisphosphate 7-phosphatase [Acidithiobacillus sp. CV18-3]MBU2756856.1 D-glycero-beta-D-manno-heptose 1,7-bisphosphate 7-phosphatase [Acidithiobacillus sp. BN09-2]MBU2778468.1 D-glycero-beta-D-manno-heptose 1,7-bisphosphate 7-phosphatase [Acidithiobacillus sp. CV18-2]MBU2795274.1 D-glycero-beta-D-manno-heptose 1,7-bisphosphate 7-phosphatase [Acidithi
MTHLLILDRDGVINEDSDAYIKSAAEWRPIPGSLEAIARFNRAGYTVVVASNQSGIGRRLFSLRALGSIHARMRRELAETGGRIDAIFFCPHHPEAGCTCRKPQAGMFREIGERFQVDLQGVPAVGDSHRDLLAARSAGASPILVLTGKGKKAADTARAEGVPVFANLAAVADALLGH